MRVVGHDLGKYHRVWHQHLNVIGGPQHRRAYADVFDDALLFFDFDRVADPKGSLQQQVDAAEEVLQDVLDGQGKRQAHRARDGHQASRTHAQDAQDDQQRHDDAADDDRTLDQNLRARCRRAPRRMALPNQFSAHPQGDPADET